MADNEKYACGYKNSQTGEIVYYKDKDARSQLKDIQTLKDNEINLVEDDTSMEGISDSVHDNLNTTNKTIIGGINEVNDKYKDIANELGRDSEGNLVDMGTTATTIRGAIKEIKDNAGGNITDEQIENAITTYLTKHPITGLTNAQLTALDNMFKVCAYIKEDISSEYNAFKNAFTSGGDTPVTKQYTITNNLTNCSNSNSATTITENSSYSATITANNDYTLENITITMGGNDITSTAYSNGNINITSVTGNVVITGTATQSTTPTETLTSISATYSGGTVVVGTSLDDLKANLVVTANYSDSTNVTVTGYTLSGSIAEGSNTITVTYQGKTTTFIVTGVAESSGDNILGELHSYKLNNAVPIAMYNVERVGNDYTITQNPNFTATVMFQSGRLIGSANIESGKIYKLSFTEAITKKIYIYGCPLPATLESYGDVGSLITTIDAGATKITFTAENNFTGLRLALSGIPMELKGVKLEEVV